MSVSGFPAKRYKTLQQMKVGDYLLCYLTGVSRWIGVLEVTSAPYQDDTCIWSVDIYPARVKVKPVVVLTPETAVPIFELRDQLSIFQDMSTPNAWTGHLRSAPQKWAQSDGEAVLNAVLEAKKQPIVRPVDKSKMRRKPSIVEHKGQIVTVPEDNLASEQVSPVETNQHLEIQWLLSKLGVDLGFSVWVARNDRNRTFEGRAFSDLKGLRESLPLQFDDATNKTIEHIDVLWLKGSAIVAAFEIESTTSIYSGLLRMSDLIAMQPNLNIPLYIVAPDDRREKVLSEVNRPTFSRLSPPMAQVCRYISFSALKRRLSEVAGIVKYLKPEFLEELSEPCEIEEV